MPLGRRTRALAVLAVLCGGAGIAAAQFVPDDKPPREPTYDGRLTSTTLLYRETGAIGTPVVDGGIAPETASPIGRYFTDLRAQLEGRALGGGAWEVRADGRARAVADERTQSGTYAGSEYEIRELYARRKGARTDWTIGRQVVLEVAATKIDGLRFVYRGSPGWEYTGFAGLYPARGSRSLTTDYPTGAPGPMAAPGETGSRILPAAGGLGAAYRTERLHGAFGVAGILPLADDAATGTLEKPRVFVTSNGYWRQSLSLDVYHYAVVDLESAAGAGVTNFSLGADFHPQPTYHLTASLHHVDTETLNVIAQTRLEDPDAGAVALVQNNVEVSRVASDEAQAGLSVALGRRRFELSVDGRLRRRPALSVTRTDGTEVVFPAAQALDLTLSAVDRKSWRGFRTGLHVTSIRGVGDANLARSRALIARLDAARSWGGGRSDLELDVSYLGADDDDQGTPCDVLDPLTCYGTSSTTTLQAGGILFRQLAKAWFAVIDLHVARQRLVVDDSMGQRAEQPAIVITTGLVRLDYRF